MTYEEVLYRFIDFAHNQDVTTDIHEKMVATIKEALEKQIPKKPLHLHKNYYCPVCKEDGWMLWDDAIPNDMDKYCSKCGQAIDWSDDE